MLQNSPCVKIHFRLKKGNIVLKDKKEEEFANLASASESPGPSSRVQNLIKKFAKLKSGNSYDIIAKIQILRAGKPASQWDALSQN